MNGEYYPAWFDTWGYPHKTGNTPAIVADLAYMLEHRASFSLYMAHGGTSFGMWAGANQPFSPDTSSYDYEAPISEAGWVTPRFTAIRNLFAQHLQADETLPAPPPANPVITVAPTALTDFAPIFSNLPASRADVVPRTMEFHDQSRGCILYRTQLPAGGAGLLDLKEVHDFAWIYLDGKPSGVMDRRSQTFHVMLPARTQPVQLDILVEAVGRVNFGPGIFDRKGIHAPVLVRPPQGEPTELTGWQVFPLPLDADQLAGLRYDHAPTTDSPSGPGFWRGTFNVTTPGDTFIDLSTWVKGVVWVNGHCLARFWNIGPTQTAYLPGPWLKSGANEIVILDLIGPRAPTIAGLANPILDVLHRELDFTHRVRATGKPDVHAVQPVLSGSFTTDQQWQDAVLATPARGRYVYLEALNAHDDKSYAAIAELELADAAGAPIANTAWKVLWVDSEESGAFSGTAENALDGQPSTVWHSMIDKKKPLPFPHGLVLDLGAARTIGHLRYMPRGGPAAETGRIKDYRLYLSATPFGLKLEGTNP